MIFTEVIDSLKFSPEGIKEIKAAANRARLWMPVYFAASCESGSGCWSCEISVTSLRMIASPNAL